MSKIKHVISKTKKPVVWLFAGKKKWLTIIVLVILSITALIVLTPKPDTREFVKAEVRDLAQVVSATGKVKASNNVELAFEGSGKVVRIVPAGTKVSAGDTIASLSTSDYETQLKIAESNLAARRAEYDSLIAGAKAEDISISEEQVESSRIAYVSAENDLKNNLGNSYSTIDNIVDTKLAGLFSKYGTENKLNFSVVNDLTAQSKIEALKNNADATDSLLSDGSYSSMSGDKLISFADSVISGTEKIRDLCDSLNTALNGQVVGVSSIDYWKTAVTASRTSAVGVTDQLRASKDKYVSARNAYSLYQKQLALKKSPATEYEKSAKLAAIASAQGQIDQIYTAMEKNRIRAPFSGTVARTDVSVGEMAVGGKNVVSLISSGNYLIEANIVESDIAKINVGDIATVDLDAYGSDVKFQAKVTMINPGEVIKDNVATYKTTFEFVEKDERIKSGMTANIDIATGEKKGVLSIPQRSIITREGKKYVMIAKIVDGKKSLENEEKEIQTGFKGSDGNTEVTSGLSAGDEIITLSSIKAAETK